MGSQSSIDIPGEWRRLEGLALHGLLLIVGQPDAGKTTLARYLHTHLSGRLNQPDMRLAYIDGDPGQSSLGPPATLTLALTRPGQSPEEGELNQMFSGSTTPRGHMLPLLVGGARLVQAAREAGAQTILYDTSGLVDPAQGGLALKQAKVDLLQPDYIIALQQENELEPLLLPLRRSQRTQVITLAPSPAARRKDQAERRANRRRQFSAYFAAAQPGEVNYSTLAVFPSPRFSLNRLVALEDRAGFCLGLGIVLSIERPRRRLTLLTPRLSLDGVAALRLGDLQVDPHTYQDSQTGR